MVNPSDTMKRPLAVMMSRTLHTIAPEATLVEASQFICDVRVDSLLVSSHGHYLGIVTETDLVRKVMAESGDLSQRRVESVMSHSIVTIEIERSISEASDLMAENGIRHLAVTQDGEIVVVISVRDLLHFKNWGTL